jgi:hypothetical protein
VVNSNGMCNVERQTLIRSISSKQQQHLTALRMGPSGTFVWPSGTSVFKPSGARCASISPTLRASAEPKLGRTRALGMQLRVGISKQVTVCSGCSQRYARARLLCCCVGSSHLVHHHMSACQLLSVAGITTTQLLNDTLAHLRQQ